MAPKGKGFTPVEYRPAAPGFTKWRGIWSEGDPGSTLPGYLLEAWNIRFDGQIIRSRPGTVNAFDVPAGSLNPQVVDEPDVAAIISHHVDKPPRRLLVLDSTLGSIDVERPKFALFDSTTGIGESITLPTVSGISTSMLGTLTCAPCWHDGKLYGGLSTSDRGALVELTSTPNFDTLRGRVVYSFAADTIVCGLLSVDDGLLVASDTNGSCNVGLWDGISLDNELTGVATIGSMIQHNGKAITHAYVPGENLLNIRATDGTWSTESPTAGTIADTRNSLNTLASVGRYVFVASGNEQLFAYDDVTGTLGPVHTLANGDGVITSVARWLNQQCAFCWYNSADTTDGVVVGRYDARATASPGVDSVITLAAADFTDVTATDLLIETPWSLLAYKSRMYVRFATGLLVSPANTLRPIDPLTPYGPQGWQLFMTDPDVPATAGGLAVI